MKSPLLIDNGVIYIPFQARRSTLTRDPRLPGGFLYFTRYLMIGSAGERRAASTNPAAVNSETVPT